MKYRHSFHAGNFADVHKHVTLVALMQALQRKAKGLLYVDTHAGSGFYELSREGSAAAEWRSGIGRLRDVQEGVAAPEIAAYLDTLGALDRRLGGRGGYPGSPLIAGQLLRTQDRGVAFERQAKEAAALRMTAAPMPRLRVEAGDGFQGLRAVLPPPERRSLVLVDPPYEESTADFARVTTALDDALQRFETGVLMAWYPIKQQRETAAWRATLEAHIVRPLLHAELRLYAADSRASLNGSGLVIVNPPYLLAERMRDWLPALYAQLAVDARGGVTVREREARTGTR